MGGEEKEKQVTVSVTLEIVLTQEDIDDIMCGALEGGITYWCDEAKVVGDYLGEYGSEQIARGGKLRLHLPEPFDKDETEYYELDLEKFKKGVELWAITPVGCNCLEQMARSDSTPAMQTQSCVMRSSSTHYSEQWFLVKEARLWQH